MSSLYLNGMHNRLAQQIPGGTNNIWFRCNSWCWIFSEFALGHGKPWPNSAATVSGSSTCLKDLKIDAGFCWKPTIVLVAWQRQYILGSIYRRGLLGKDESVYQPSLSHVPLVRQAWTGESEDKFPNSGNQGLPRELSAEKRPEDDVSGTYVEGKQI
jgi:hypothetical protein